MPVNGTSLNVSFTTTTPSLNTHRPGQDTDKQSATRMDARREFTHPKLDERVRSSACPSRFWRGHQELEAQQAIFIYAQGGFCGRLQRLDGSQYVAEAVTACTVIRWSGCYPLRSEPLIYFCDERT